MTLLVAAAALCALIFSTAAFAFTAWNSIELRAMQKSTHNYVVHNPLADLDATVPPMSQAEKEALAKQLDDNE